MDGPRQWYAIRNVDAVPSPALLLYPDRIAENVRRMLAIAGGPERLRPHVKTHKLPELVRMQLEAGITRFKCSTVAEAEMLAREGCADVLLAYQPVGPNIARLCRLASDYPATSFSALVDDDTVARAVSAACVQSGVRVGLAVDLDTGMARTGVPPGGAAERLYRLIDTLPGVQAAGLHAYDGHLRQSDARERQKACDAAFEPVARLRESLVAAGLDVPRVVVGGTPTFRFHARRDGVECSPGTCVLWDAEYAATLPDLDFEWAALVLTRVVSTPGDNRVCLDLGHKAIASEKAPPRVVLLDAPDLTPIGHSEEHLVLQASGARPGVGTAVYGVPWHVCPTVALYNEAVVVEDGYARATWRVVARDRRLSV